MVSFWDRHHQPTSFSIVSNWVVRYVADETYELLRVFKIEFLPTVGLILETGPLRPVVFPETINGCDRIFATGIDHSIAV